MAFADDRDITPLIVLDSNASNSTEEVSPPQPKKRKAKEGDLTAYQRERLAIKREEAASKKEYREFMMSKFDNFLGKI